MRRLAIFAALVAAVLLASCSTMKSAAEKSVWFVEPKDGATVTSPFKVVFGVKGMAVDPAGDIKADSGHHHLLINLGPMSCRRSDSRRRHAPSLRQGADRSRSRRCRPGNTS